MTENVIKLEDQKVGHSYQCTEKKISTYGAGETTAFPTILKDYKIHQLSPVIRPFFGPLWSVFATALGARL